jgi:ABC-type proline/glycine betaine transport system permease subunit
MTLREFLSRNGGELLTLTFEHLLLVLVSTGIAILIGVPL